MGGLLRETETTLPTDRPRPPVQTYRGDAHTWTLAHELAERIRALAARQRATLFIVKLAAFQVLLHRLTGQDEIILGTATAGRNRPEWEDVVGYCLNQVPLRVVARVSSAIPSISVLFTNR